MDVTIHGGFDTGMTQQLLQYFRHDTALNGPCGIGVSQSVHTKPLDFRLIAQLVQVGIVGAVLSGFAGAVIYEHQIPHTQVPGLACPSIHVFQDLGQQF